MQSRQSKTSLSASLIVIALLSGCGSAAAGKPVKGGAKTPAGRVSSGLTRGTAVKTAHNAKLGTILVTRSGMTLYHLTTEKAGKIVCVGGCAKIWPPLLEPSGTRPTGISGLTTIQRPGGKEQVAFRGMPLYTYAPDKKPGQTLGQGVGGIWFVVKPSGTSTSTKSGPGY